MCPLFVPLTHGSSGFRVFVIPHPQWGLALSVWQVSKLMSTFAGLKGELGRANILLRWIEFGINVLPFSIPTSKHSETEMDLKVCSD